MIAGVIARLSRECEDDLVFVDVDCLVARNLDEAFERPEPFDVGLTARDNPVSPINNGVMYVPARGRSGALSFFRAALMRCRNHWGGDQEAISEVAKPILPDNTMEMRAGARVLFLPIKKYAVVPKTEGVRHEIGPFVVHFKGEKKDWMGTYAEKFILNGEPA